MSGAAVPVKALELKAPQPSWSWLAYCRIWLTSVFVTLNLGSCFDLSSDGGGGGFY